MSCVLNLQTMSCCLLQDRHNDMMCGNIMERTRTRAVPFPEERASTADGEARDCPSWFGSARADLHFLCRQHSRALKVICLQLSTRSKNL